MTSCQCLISKSGTIVAALTFAIAPAALAQSARIQASEQILSPAGDVVEHDSFGSAVAVDGHRMVIGGFNADGNEVGAGAAFVFERGAGGWVQTARLFAADGKAEPVPGIPGDFRSDSFGLTVAMSGDTIAVGAPGHKHTGHASNSGAVYVFQLVKGTWVQQAELFSPHPNSQDEFGAGQGFGGIGVSGDTVVVTDQGNGFSLAGSVDVFTRTNGQWALSAQLTVPDDPFFFPTSAAIDGDTVAAGSSISDSPTTFEAGAAYVFQFAGGQWSAPVAIGAADGVPFAQFGASISLRNNVLAAGAVTAPGATGQSGAAYVFTRSDGSWNQVAKLTADDGADFDNFGTSVSVFDQTVAVGANGHTPSSSGVPAAGAAYVFRQQDDVWRSVAELAGSDAISGGDFGNCVAVFDNMLLVGADQQHPPIEGYAGGEAYIYKLNPR